MPKLFQLIDAFAAESILVVGDIMLDEYIHGTVERISPEAPVPVVVRQEVRTLLGGAGNVLRNLHSLGANLYLATAIGCDEGGQHLRRLLQEIGLAEENLCLVETAHRPTTRKTRIFAAHQQVCRLDHEVIDPLTGEQEEQLLEMIKKSIPKVSAVLISDYDKGLVTRRLIEETVQLAHRSGRLITVDPQVTHFSYYQNVDLLTPNHHEVGRLLGRSLKSDAEVELAGQEIMEKLRARMLLMTRGEKGMTLFEQGAGAGRHFSTRAQEVYDVTGAGDTVISLFTLALAVGAHPEQAVELSNCGASRVITHLGAATVTPEELKACLKADSSTTTADYPAPLNDETENKKSDDN